MADLLHAGMQRMGISAARSFEAVQTPAGQAWLEEHQGRWFHAIEKSLSRGQMLHLHSSSDWLALLTRLRTLPPFPCAITLHDMSLATGGCISPLGCSNFANACQDPCPRGLPETKQRREQQADALRALAPVVMCPSAWGRTVTLHSMPWLQVHVAPNGVPWPAALPQKDLAKQTWHITPSAKLVLFIAHGGEAAGVKAGSRWQSIWERIKAAVPSAVGFLVGGHEHAREGDVFRWPYATAEQLYSMFAAADCLVYPTLADNHPLTILEAFAHGCPVAAWEVGGIPEMIRHQRIGMLVKMGDEAGLADAAVRILRRPSLGLQLASNAHARGKRHFTAERMVRSVVDIITESHGA